MGNCFPAICDLMAVVMSHRVRHEQTEPQTARFGHVERTQSKSKYHDLANGLELISSKTFFFSLLLRVFLTWLSFFTTRVLRRYGHYVFHFGRIHVHIVLDYKGSGRAGARGPRPSSVKDDLRRQGHSEKKKPYQVRRCGVLR